MTLSVIATPLGNLGDISKRSLFELSRATLIIAEDTRSIKKLLTLLEIDFSHKQFISSHAQSSDSATARAISACGGHEYIALVTDAGTPGISDPGSHFIGLYKEAYPQAQVLPIPGPSAVISALSVSGFPVSHFEFLGFIPHKKGRMTLFSQLPQKAHTVVFFESPHRIIKTLESLKNTLEKRKIFIAREMTKQFETYLTGTSEEMLEHFTRHSEQVRGEFVVVIEPL